MKHQIKLPATSPLEAQGFGALSESFELKGADLVGLHMFDSTGNAIDGEITLNYYGLAGSSCPSRKHVVVTRNVVDIDPSLLCPADEPYPVPEPP